MVSGADVRSVVTVSENGATVGSATAVAAGVGVAEYTGAGELLELPHASSDNAKSTIKLANTEFFVNMSTFIDDKGCSLFTMPENHPSVTTSVF
jgi:hypothetical protein